MIRQPFFDSGSARYALKVAALDWWGTPFRENSAVKGRDGGVDCVQFIHEIFVEAGACDRMEIPVRPVEVVRHWHEHHAVSLITEWLGSPELRGRLERIDDPFDLRQTGDLVAFHIGQTEHHLGVVIESEIWHVARPAGVVVHSIRDPEVERMIRCRYRLMEVAS